MAAERPTLARCKDISGAADHSHFAIPIEIDMTGVA